MKVYLVGGYVRDKLLGINLENADKDYVVVGSTPEEMLKLGYKQVGNQFPVFLHPDTSEEYALARKEKKVSSGHQGFDFDFNQNITLEEDLLRRDFTINAMVETSGGEFIDPLNGKQDLDDKLLRHVSDHFNEDPLRVLRAARFSATLGFNIADETMALMAEMVDLGELKSLSKERVLLEVKKTLLKGNISIFIDVLEKLNAWNFLFGDKFENCIDDSYTFKEKKIFFYFGVEKEKLNSFPLSTKLLKIISRLKNFEILSKSKDWQNLFTSLEAWKPGGDIFTETLQLICLRWGSRWQWLAEMRLFVRENLDKAGLNTFKGEAYGNELSRRQNELIKQFEVSNPLK